MALKLGRGEKLTVTKVVAFTELPTSPHSCVRPPTFKSSVGKVVVVLLVMLTLSLCHDSSSTHKGERLRTMMRRRNALRKQLQGKSSQLIVQPSGGADQNLDIHK